MRFSPIIVAALAATLLAAPAARAENTARNFGSTNCRQTFNCGDAESIDLVGVAESCMATSLGISVDFSGASLDGNNCLSSAGSGKTTTICCLVPAPNQDALCKLSCSIMVQ